MQRVVDTLTRAPLVLVGGAAQMIHTGHERLTDIDMIGPIDSGDRAALAEARFVLDGRHWIHGSTNQEIAIEVAGNTLLGEETPESIDIEGVLIQVISVNDLIMDRLIQATDGTPVTWDEALSLGVAAQDRVDWTLIESRCRAAAVDDLFLRKLPDVLDRLRKHLT